jgi:hypothetical protein
LSWRTSGAAAAALALLLGYAFWLLGHPASLPSDDALFFVRAVTRFSVLELSPHFPGYPAFVLAARGVDALAHDPARSIFLTGALAALSIPPALYFWVRGAGVAPGFAFAAAVCALFQPSLPGIAVSMLSDPLGIALALWCLVAVQRERFGVGGVLMGLCVAARPSCAVLALALFAVLLARRRDALWSCALGFGAVGAASAAFVLAADGLAYFAEGLRFTAGHFEIWGRGAGAGSWLRDVLGLAGGAVNAAVLAGALGFALRSLQARELATAAALWMAVAYAAWILCAQNPDSARHAVPLLFLALGIAAIGLGQSESRGLAASLTALLLASTLQGFVSSVDRGQRAAPLERASAELAGRAGTLLITQWGVEWMREQHPELRIFDPYYAASARLAAQSETKGEVLRLSTSPLAEPWVPLRELPARFPGEKSLTLYALRADPG